MNNCDRYISWPSDILVGITLQAMYGGSNFLLVICTSHIPGSDQHTLGLQWVVKSHQHIINHLQYTYKTVIIPDNET